MHPISAVVTLGIGAAILILTELPKPLEKRRELEELLETLRREDLLEARRRLENLQPALRRLEELLEALRREDLPGARRRLEGLLEALRRLEELLEALRREDLPEARRRLANLQPALRRLANLQSARWRIGLPQWESLLAALRQDDLRAARLWQEQEDLQVALAVLLRSERPPLALEERSLDALEERLLESLPAPAPPRGAARPLRVKPEPLTAPFEDTRFTVYHPKEIAPERWDTLLVYTHVPELQEWVHSDAQRRLEQLEGHGRRTDRARRDIAKGAEIVVIPELPGCRFNPPTDRFLWLEDAYRREFRLCADPNVPGFAPGTAVNGCVAFYVASILVAEVKIWAFITDQPDSAAQTRAGPWPPEVKAGLRNIAPMSSIGLSEAVGTPPVASLRHAMASAERYRAIFVSYAHEDNTIVKRLAVAYKILGDVFLRDQEVLRSGEKWNPRLLDLIDRADIFQLYWSRPAQRSRYVEQEWRHALKQGRDNFIRPVYWQKPMPEPPRELADLHFAYLQLGGWVQAVLTRARLILCRFGWPFR